MEKVKLVYDGNQIEVNGETFKLVLPITTSELTSVYLTGAGEGKAQLTIKEVKIEEKAAQSEQPAKKTRKKVKKLEEIKSSDNKNKWDNFG